MAVWTLGLNHRTAPIDLRERFALASDQLLLSLQGLRSTLTSHKEVAILSTCNRTEIYCAGEQVQWQQTLGWLADVGKAQVDTLQSHIYRLEGGASARHAGGSRFLCFPPSTPKLRGSVDVEAMKHV